MKTSEPFTTGECPRDDVPSYQNLLNHSCFKILQLAWLAERGTFHIAKDFMFSRFVIATTILGVRCSHSLLIICHGLGQRDCSLHYPIFARIRLGKALP